MMSSHNASSVCAIATGALTFMSTTLPVQIAMCSMHCDYNTDDIVTWHLLAPFTLLKLHAKTQQQFYPYGKTEAAPSDMHSDR